MVWKKLLAHDADALALLVRHYDSDTLLVLLNDASAPSVKKLAGRLQLAYTSKTAAVRLIADACSEARDGAEASHSDDHSDHGETSEDASEADEHAPAQRVAARGSASAASQQRARINASHGASASKPRGRSLPSDDVLAALASLPSPSRSSPVPRRHGNRDTSRSPRARKHTSASKRSAQRKEATDSDSDGHQRAQHRRTAHRRRSSPSPSSSSTDTDSDSSSTASSELSTDESSHHRGSKLSYASHGSRRRHAVDDAMDSTGGSRPIAGKVLRRILARGPNVHHVTRYDTTFKSERNRRECLALAKVLDALLARDVELAKELAMRRYTGVQLSDTSGDWNYCDVVEGVMDKHSYLPEEFLQRVVKSVMRVEALDKSATTSKPAARKRYGGGNAYAPSHASGASGSSRKGEKGRGRSSSRGPQGRGSSGAPAGAGKKKNNTGGTARGGSDQE